MPLQRQRWASPVVDTTHVVKHWTGRQVGLALAPQNAGSLPGRPWTDAGVQSAGEPVRSQVNLGLTVVVDVMVTMPSAAADALVDWAHGLADRVVGAGVSLPA